MENEISKSEELPQILRGRETNIEILRIISMILIIAHHLSVHGGYNLIGFDNISEFNQALINLFAIGGKLGVNIFVIISGYFLIKSNLKLRKVIKLVAEIFLYSVLIYLIILICKETTFSLSNAKMVFLPIISESYWFVTAYIIMYLLSPFINKCLNNITQTQHLLLIAFLLFLQTILPYLFSNYLGNVGWFITLYAIGAFIKNYSFNLYNNTLLFAAISIVLFILIALFKIFLNINLSEITNPICTICAITTFVTFRSLNIKTNKIINTIASTTFGIYLIHDNYFLRPILWTKLLKCPQYATTNDFWWFSILVIMAIFIICVIVDLCRIYLLEKPFMFGVDKLLNVIKNKLAKREK